MSIRLSFHLVCAASCAPLFGIPLSQLSNTANYNIGFVNEASAVTYNRDTGTLFAIGDEGEALYQITKKGQLINSMTFDNSGPRAGRTLDDPEGVTYMGNGKFMIADERRNVGWITEFTPGTMVGKNTMPGYAFGPPDGNTGLEGVAYDSINNSVWGVRELGPVRIYEMTGIGQPDFAVDSAPFPLRGINRLGIVQLSDIYVMAESAAFGVDDPRRNHILLLSRDFDVVIEVDRDGNVFDVLDISSIYRDTIEGMTMDDAGNLYLVSEGFGGTESQLHVFSVVPEPSTYALILGSLLGGFAVLRKRRQKAAA